MEKRFTVLRIIGTIWKVLAWIELVLGVLVAVGALIAGIFGAAVVSDYVPVPARASWGYTIAGSIIAFVAILIATILYFLLLYGIGEFLHLLLAIEENTRQAAQQVDWMVHQAPGLGQEAMYASPVASYSPPPPAPMPGTPSEEPAGAGPGNKV